MPRVTLAGRSSPQCPMKGGSKQPIRRCGSGSRTTSSFASRRPTAPAASTCAPCRVSGKATSVKMPRASEPTCDGCSSEMPHPLYLVPAAFLMLFLLERLIPLRRAKSRLGSRLWVNAVVSSLAIAVAVGVVRPVATAVLQFVSERDWSLTSIVSENSAVQAALGFLLMDLSFYYWHRANHAWPFLWRFHNAHHVDHDLDVSTAVRFHFVEVGLSAGFRALQVSLIGGAPWVFVVYETVFQL